MLLGLSSLRPPALCTSLVSEAGPGSHIEVRELEDTGGVEARAPVMSWRPIVSAGGPPPGPVVPVLDDLLSGLVTSFDESSSSITSPVSNK